ncbi:S1C family serine protease [Halorarius litoreus]|uniref:S1C family serine protease n=1 Tax=Halorarius litoreus TaxID=2962676 RepID=UPI0020CE1DA5|nr:trypsin-like peptidase domain-containing protein [Halorarius litoreus]
MDQSTRRRFLQLSASAAAVGLAGCSSGYTGAVQPEQRATGGQATATATETPAAEPAPESVFTQVYREVIDSVVQIETDAGQGTAFVFDGAHVVTNAHVVGRAETASVRFRDGTWADGEVVGTDVYSDLAVVEVADSPAAATPLPLQRAAPVVGQEVVVIGNPFGLSGTLTTGVVSGVNRSIPSPAGFRIPDAVQTDAAVNPGNSGGPIVSLDGEVVAVINSGGGDNVAFGISSTLTRRVVPALIADGEYDHSYIGVGLLPVSPAVAEVNDLDAARGVLVTEVFEGTPAAGVLQGSDDSVLRDGRELPVGGDVLVAIDDQPIRTSEDLGSYLALETSPGQTVTLTLLRDGDERAVDLTLGERPAP